MSGMSRIQKITVGFGLVYVLIGILGFIPPLVAPSTQPGQGLLLGIFAVNGLHNIAHLLVGAIMVFGGWMPATVVNTNRIMAVIFALLTLASFIAPLVEQVALNAPDTILHLVSTLLTAYLGFMLAGKAMQMSSAMRR